MNRSAILAGLIDLLLWVLIFSAAYLALCIGK